MPDQDNPILAPLPMLGGPPGPPDLTKFHENTRTAVWAHVYNVVFLDPYLTGGGIRSDSPLPIDAAERAELMVFWAFGRWFAAWRNYELHQHLPLEHRWEVVQIKADPDAPNGLMLHEV